jgi:hypothetical protein
MVAHERRAILVVTSILLLFLSACLLVVMEELSPAAPDRRSEEFQRLVGGLGMGPAVDLSRCGFSFDPRLCQDCPFNYNPVPGGVCFCSEHACSILYCRRPIQTERQGDKETRRQGE